jgi:hypothetical protein
MPPLQYISTEYAHSQSCHLYWKRIYTEYDHWPVRYKLHTEEHGHWPVTYLLYLQYTGHDPSLQPQVTFCRAWPLANPVTCTLVHNVEHAYFPTALANLSLMQYELHIEEHGYWPILSLMQYELHIEEHGYWPIMSLMQYELHIEEHGHWPILSLMQYELHIEEHGYWPILSPVHYSYIL